jgi:23S rRNA pseudouridine1911/1915/1917 synthase
MSVRPNPPTQPKPDEARGRTVTFSVAVAVTERLDRFLADQLAFSRTQAARLIAAGGIRVDGQPARASRVLDRGACVAVVLPVEAPPRHLVPRARDLAVVFEDDALLVLDKPAGLVVHPAPGHWDDTLLNALVARGTALSGGGAGRPGIVHRLDKDTSGLLVVAKTDQAHRVLAGALGRRQVERRYAVLVWGHVEPEVEIDAPIGRNPRDRKRMAVVASGRPARTGVSLVARFATCDLVRARLVTGRTHQIRVHLAHVGHPVVGDPVYAHGGARRMTGVQRPVAERIERSLTRQALHAAELRLRHPTSGAPIVFRSEWPADLRPALATAARRPELVDRADPLQYLGFFDG